MTTQSSEPTLYASVHPDIARRISLPCVFYSLAMLLAGVALFVTLFEIHEKSSVLSMLSMVVGAVLILYAVFRLFWRSKELIYLPTGSVARERTLFFDLKYLRELSDLIDHDRLSGETTMQSDASGNVRLDVMLSKDGRFAAVQLFQFVPYSYRPVTSVHYYTGSDAASVSDFVNRCKRV